MKEKFVLLELTKTCNLKCLYCYNVWKKDNKKSKITKKHLSFNKIKKVLDKLFKHINPTGIICLKKY